LPSFAYSYLKRFAVGKRVRFVHLVDAFVYAKPEFSVKLGFSLSFWLEKVMLKNGFFRAIFP